MDNEERLVGRVVAAAGGEIVGRVRLQKVFYLLDQLGLNSGFSYSYHHYGPYSADLADAVDGAKAFRFIQEEARSRRSDGMPFGAFKMGTEAVGDVEILGSMQRDQVQRFLLIMNSRSATVLELAATTHWLRDKLRLPNWRDELVVRKGQKTADGRADEALRLLDDLGLSQA